MVLAKVGAFLNLLPGKTRTLLAGEGREIKQRLESLGYPRLWGAIPPELMQMVQGWQDRCREAGLSQAAVFDRIGKDPEHTSGAEVLLIVDEAVLALDPPGSMGG